MAAGLFEKVSEFMMGRFGRWLDGAKERERVRQERHILAATLGAELDRYVTNCLEVSYDDGTTEGRPASDCGLYHQATVSLPTFDPHALKVDLKALPPDLMYEILDLPSRAAKVRQVLNDPGFHDPPDFPAYFEARQKGYAELGLIAGQLARRLRGLVGVQQALAPLGMRGTEDQLRERYEQLEDEEVARNKRWAVSQARAVQTQSDE